MRRVGNNWRITWRMHYKKKARGGMLEHMVLHALANLVPPIPLPSTNYLILVFLDDNHKGMVRWGNVLPKSKNKLITGVWGGEACTTDSPSRELSKSPIFSIVFSILRLAQGVTVQGFY